MLERVPNLTDSYDPARAAERQFPTCFHMHMVGYGLLDLYYQTVIYVIVYRLLVIVIRILLLQLVYQAIECILFLGFS